MPDDPARYDPADPAAFAAYHGRAMVVMLTGTDGGELVRAAEEYLAAVCVKVECDTLAEWMRRSG